MSARIVDSATARRDALVAAIWVPLAIVILSEVVIIAAGAMGKPRLIVNWGTGADRFGPWWSYTILVAAIGFPVIALMGFFLARATRMAGMNAWMPAISLGITIFHALGMGVGSVLLNASPLAPALPLAGGAALAIGVALLTWRLLPREASASTGVVPADALPVRAGEVAAWTGKVDLPGWFLSLIAAIASVLVGLGVLLLLVRGWQLWPLFLVPAVLFVVLLLTAQFSVIAGPRGFLVRSAFGWPRLSIPTGELARAGVVTIDPLADFGGWGIRWVVGPNHRGRWGVITRRGQGIEVVRRDGRSIVVTIDDAGSAAAILETYAKGRAAS
jgi:hypothetical protein